MFKSLKKIWALIKKHKWWSIGIGVFLIISALILPRRIISYVKGPAGQYLTAEVTREAIQQTISASGEIEAEDQVTLTFQTAGQLAWVGVKEGDLVKKGQAVASLDKRELQKDLKTELNDYMNERWNFEDDRDTYNVISDNLDDYTLTSHVRRILEKAQFDLNNSVIDVEIADLAIKLATIYSPINGIVTSIEAPIAGVNVTTTTADFIIAGSTEMKFVANVDEADVGLVRPGQTATIVLDAYLEEPIDGLVDQIAFAAVTTSGGGTAFPVNVPLPDNYDQRYKVGMNGDVEIVIQSAENSLTVPLEAVKETEEKVYVQIIEGRKVKEIPVKIGLESDSRVEILQGVEEGQMVITGKKPTKKKK